MAKTPRQRRKSKTQNAILDIATQLIVEVGYENVSLREIARLADYSPAGLYKHFSSKAAIIHAVQARESERLLAELEKVPADLSPAERLIELCLRYVQYCLENPAFLILVTNLPSSGQSPEQPIPSQSPYLVYRQAAHDWLASEAITLPARYGLDGFTYALWAQVQGMATLRFRQLQSFAADFVAINQLSLEIFLTGVRQWKEK